MRLNAERLQNSQKIVPIVVGEEQVQQTFTAFTQKFETQVTGKSETSTFLS